MSQIPIITRNIVPAQKSVRCQRRPYKYKGVKKTNRDHLSRPCRGRVAYAACFLTRFWSNVLVDVSDARLLRTEVRVGRMAAWSPVPMAALAPAGALALSSAASSEGTCLLPSTITTFSMGSVVRTARGDACGNGDSDEGAGLPELARMCPGRPTRLSEPVESVLAMARLASEGAAAAVGATEACCFLDVDEARCRAGADAGVANRPKWPCGEPSEALRTGGGCAYAHVEVGRPKRAFLRLHTETNRMRFILRL